MPILLCLSLLPHCCLRLSTGSMGHAERPLAGPHPTVGRPRRPLYECRFMAAAPEDTTVIRSMYDRQRALHGRIENVARCLVPLPPRLNTRTTVVESFPGDWLERRISAHSRAPSQADFRRKQVRQ